MDHLQGWLDEEGSDSMPDLTDSEESEDETEEEEPLSSRALQQPEDPANEERSQSPGYEPDTEQIHLNSEPYENGIITIDLSSSESDLDTTFSLKHPDSTQDFRRLYIWAKYKPRYVPSPSWIRKLYTDPNWKELVRENDYERIPRKYYPSSHIKCSQDQDCEAKEICYHQHALRGEEDLERCLKFNRKDPTPVEYDLLYPLLEDQKGKEVDTRMDLLLNTTEFGWSPLDKGENCWVMMNNENPSLELEIEYPPDCNLTIKCCQVAHRRCHILTSPGCHTRELMDLQLIYQIDLSTVPFYAIMSLKEDWESLKLDMESWSNQEVHAFTRQQAKGKFDCSEKDLTKPMYLLLVGMLENLCQTKRSEYIGPKMCEAIEELTATFPHETPHGDLEYQCVEYLPHGSPICVDSLRIRCSPFMIKLKQLMVRTATDLKLVQVPHKQELERVADETESEAEEGEETFMGLICLTDPSETTNDGNSEGGTNHDLRKNENTAAGDDLESINLQEVDKALDKKEKPMF
jgi:hypothetical protein